MTTVMTAREYADYSGTDLAKLEAAIREAESDFITRDSMDPSSLRVQGSARETEAKMRGFLESAASAGALPDTVR